MAQTVADLEADGLVSRRRRPDDGRRALVELTEHGLAALREPIAATARAGSRSAIADDFSAEEQAVLQQAAGLLRRLAES